MSESQNRLAELREAREWHRSKVAGAFNVGERTVQRWENGETPVPSDLIPALAKLFGVSTDHLMGWDREPVTGKAAA
jgi:transcriptional regulator with XRE-family HTH domain